ncbi:uricase [Silurus asotus]|uniref:Uricase n=1 Tax=Silurus asotus TaxID=30991 RepID=A0AAD5AEV6_SILAS|nr:uricase [Silurus asotus]
MATSNKNVEFVRTGYGKNHVKLLYIRRERDRHYIMELKANVQLTLNSVKDYLTGDNSDIIPTDTIKNTVHALAKLKGVKTIEAFALDICNHFLTAFKHVTRAKVNIEEAPWKRIEKNAVEHAHAFIFSPEFLRFCEVEQYRNEVAVIHSGIRDLKVLKTTQSGFEGFLRDRFTTLKDVKDRVFCTSVYARWRYNKYKEVNFDMAWNSVKETIIERFAGPYDRGEYSPSVQKTLYDTQILVLERLPEASVLLPLDNPSGNITGTVCRKPQAKL